MRKAYWNMSLSNRLWAYKLMTDLWELVHRLQGPSLQTETTLRFAYQAGIKHYS